VKRPLRIEVAHQDLGGEHHTVQLEGFLARIWLHEMDHLNGILFIDHLASTTAARRCAASASTGSSRASRTPSRSRATCSSAALSGGLPLLGRAGIAHGPAIHHLRSNVRIAFLGTPDVAVPALEAFVDADDVEVAVVITNPGPAAGSRGTPQPPPVKVAAEAAGLEVWQPAKPREVLEDLRALEVDACAVVAYGALLPADVLEAGGRGFVNLHFSLLPRWRGAAPVQHAIRAGDRRSPA
jgi:hypothetical protein